VQDSPLGDTCCGDQFSLGRGRQEMHRTPNPASGATRDVGAIPTVLAIFLPSSQREQLLVTREKRGHHFERRFSQRPAEESHREARHCVAWPQDAGCSKPESKSGAYP
jgi:hypothetical protein